MSGECYSAKNLSTEHTSKKENKTVDNMNLEHTPSQCEDNQQLLRYETMVSSAENKCSQLKGQLERMRIMYNNQSEAARNSTARSADASLMKPVGMLDMKNYNFMKSTKKVRQNSQAIRTDHTGAALGTINNIFAGITKPIGLKEFSQPEIHKKLDEKISEQLENVEDPLHGVEEVKINTKSKQSIRVRSKAKFYLRKSKPKVVSITSSTNLKKTKRTPIKLSIEKRHTIGSDIQVNAPKTGVPIMTTRSRKMVLNSKHRVLDCDPSQDTYSSIRRYTPQHADLVEIYHNTAVKETKSSDSDIPKQRNSSKSKKAETDVNLIPPLKIERNENDNQEIVSSSYKNYTQPTISSRMKQAAKYYMNSFNIKTIPFCPVTSTSPSHNIGINIQQVMSMVKSNQPVGRLSPTLAYNIGLAAGKREQNQFPFLVSSIATRSLCLQCPLNRSAVNYQQLQEIAKTIPQEIIEEPEEIEDIPSPDTQSLIITGPSGDVKVKNRKQTVWSANTDEKRCTCVVSKGVGFQQIVNKFNNTISKNSKQFCTVPPVTSVEIKEQKIDNRGGGEESEPTPLQNKEKKLKEVLGKLHEEFEKMTSTYDELAKKTERGNAHPEVLKQLETLDKELNSKEEEIIMVMSLYKEVLALKQQVKTLKERTSRENVSIKSQQTKFNGCKNIATAQLLNKLLQRVQHFQTHYKKK
ncbi:uncharacterized protein LOC135135193 isoform X2 [Zophobas morio]|uniref:uncharacterized protein LOC135135193 isoform X2 n=1 Tax=Zophobas morio TaxID=2755281 RepID=UPI0030834458